MTSLPGGNKGIAVAKIGDNTSAITLLNRALKLNPEYINALNNRGTVYMSLGRSADGLRDFEKALELEPSFIQTKVGKKFSGEN